MKKTLVLFLFVLFSLSQYAQTKIKISCIGNSVTYGALLPEREKNAYPYQLQQMLGDKYEVRNFGYSGATLLSKGHKPYINQQVYQDALDYAADIVIIHLGLNDTDPSNWPNYKDDFFRDYINLIDSFRKVNPHSKIWICRLSPIGDRHPRFRSGTRDWYQEIQNTIERIASYSNVGLIDLQSELYNRPHLLPDALHPNSEGAGILAKTVYSALTGNYGGLQIPIIYSDNMVLQRNIPLKIKGIADAGEKVRIQINGQDRKTTTQADGKWSIMLDPMLAGGPYKLKISTEKRSLQYTNVMVGEVWLCSGQSNMAFMLNEDVSGNESIKNADNNLIRSFDMKPRWNTNAIEWDKSVLDSVNNLEYYKTPHWNICTSDYVGNFSAVAYYFGKTLADSLKVPIGLIHNSVGGSPTESWIDRHTLEYEFPDILNNWKENDFIQNWVRERASLNIKQAKNKLQRHPYEPCYLFEAGIIPLEQYSIKGVIWYQGESNAHNIETHEKLFPLLTESWRKNWNDTQLPIYYVQLSSLNRPSWTWFRDSQRRLMDRIPNTHMVVSSDKGDSLDVHPRNKKPIGERLAFQALYNTYNLKDIIPSGPIYRSVTFKNGTAYISFDYSEGMHSSDGKELQTFEIAEIEELYFPAKAVVENNTIKVWLEDIKSPRYVRYGWQPFTRANLVNKTNLPASTFKTENDMKTIANCKPLPDLPIQGGVSAPFTGLYKDKLIVAGGCNFPDKPASEGGVKAFYNDVFVLDISDNATNKSWIKCEALPYKAAYGASVSTPKGLVCIGGQNKDGSLTNVTLIKYDVDSTIFTELPHLPTGLFNGGASLIGSTIYITGGGSSSKTKGFIFTLDLEKLENGWTQITMPTDYERQQPVVVVQKGQLFVAGGYDEAEAKVFTDVIRYNPQKKQWDTISEINAGNNAIKTLVGAAGVPYKADQILFMGGVNYNLFSSALKRIKKTKEAQESGDTVLADSLKLIGKEYMSQEIGWYKFETELMSLDLKTNNWETLGEFPQLARAGAGVAIWKNKIYIICGELKPGIRTAEVNCITIN